MEKGSYGGNTFDVAIEFSWGQSFPGFDRDHLRLFCDSQTCELYLYFDSLEIRFYIMVLLHDYILFVTMRCAI